MRAKTEAFFVIECPAITDQMYELETYGVFSYMDTRGRKFHGLFNSVGEAQSNYPQAEWHGYGRTGYAECITS